MNAWIKPDRYQDLRIDGVQCSLVSDTCQIGV